MGLLSEEIPPYEALIHEEELPPLNLKLILDCISSVPLYDRLDIDKGSICENEKKLMELQAKKYNDMISNFINDQKIETHNDVFSKLESEYSQLEEFLDLFLKNFYNCSDNDELLMRIKENLPFDEAIQKSPDEVKLVTEVEQYTPSKDFLQFFLNVSDGKHDNLVIYESSPSNDLSSDVSSDEKDETMEDKIKELSCKLKFCDSSNSKFLEPIISASNLSAFEIITENSCKIPALKKEELFLSDSESENDLKKKQLAFKGNKACDIKSQFQKKKDLKVLKKKKEKFDSRDVINNFKKSIESKSGEKKAIENIQRPRSHSNITNMDQPKINLDKFTTSAGITNVLDSPRQLININENIKKDIDKKQVNNDTSSSSDENWEDLAAKNLFLRSKNLEQKVAMKK